MDTRPLQRSKPRGLLRLVFRLPVYLYRFHLGWLLGHRFLLLTHRGRKTGKVHHTVLEVIRYDSTNRESIVVSAYGEDADWYRNIKMKTALEIQTGLDRYHPIQRLLTPEETYTELVDYEKRHLLAARFLPKLIGLQYDGSESGRRTLVTYFRMVSFHPKDKDVPQ